MVVNGSESGWSYMTSGIPQCSVLGPILFPIYINDLPDIVEVLMKLFADVSIHTVTKSRENELQPNLDRAVKWAKDWEMFYNTDKCHQLHIGKQDTDFRFIIQTRNQRTQLERVDKEKDLGVTVDSKLNFRVGRKTLRN